MEDDDDDDDDEGDDDDDEEPEPQSDVPWVNQVLLPTHPLLLSLPLPSSNPHYR